MGSSLKSLCVEAGISTLYTEDIIFYFEHSLPPQPLPPSHITKCSEKQWLVWLLSASLPSMLTPLFKNVMELTLMTMDTLLHHLTVMQNLLPPMAHHLHPIANPLPLMGSHSLHMENLLQVMEVKKQLC